MRHPYPSYRDSGVAWLGEVPAHWEVKRLKLVASTNDEALSDKEDPLRPIAYVDIGSVDSTAGITETEEMVFEDAPSRARRLVRDGDTIVSTVRTYLRAIAPVREPPDDMVVSTGFAVIRPRHLDSGFASWALRQHGFVEEIVACSVGVSYPAINPSRLADLPIPLPPLDEQRNIAAFLDKEVKKIDELVVKKRVLMERLDEYRQALITRTVTRGLPPDDARAAGLDPSPRLRPSGVKWLGAIPDHWEVRHLGAVLHDTVSGGTPTTTNELYWANDTEDGLPWVTIADMSAGGLVLDTEKRITPLGCAAARLQPLAPGTIIYSMYASVGAVARLGTRAATNQAILGLLHSPFVDPLFLYWSLIALRPAVLALTRDNTQSNLNAETVRKIPLALPPLDEQRALAAFLDEKLGRVDALTSRVEVAIERLDEYRAALIAAAVTGKIDVRGGATYRPRLSELARD